MCVPVMGQWGLQPSSVSGLNSGLEVDRPLHARHMAVTVYAGTQLCLLDEPLCAS